MKHHRFATALCTLATFCLLIGGQALAEPQRDADKTEAEPGLVLDDFNDIRAAIKRWTTVNDNVMGGKSKGGPTFANGVLTFAGSTNTDGGGFSSIRTNPEDHDLSGQAGLLLRVRGDGRTYMASLRTDASTDRWKIPFRAEFETVEGEWQTVFIPFEKFTPTFWGREIRDNPPTLELDKVQAIGLMIYDKKDGPFKLEVDWIKAVKRAPETKEEKQPEQANAQG